MAELFCLNSSTPSIFLSHIVIFFCFWDHILHLSLPFRVSSPQIMISIVVLKRKTLACIVFCFCSLAPNGLFPSQQTVPWVSWFAVKPRSSFLPFYLFDFFCESPLSPCCLLRNHGFSFCFPSQNGSPESGHDTTGQISPLLSA